MWGSLGFVPCCLLPVAFLLFAPLSQSLLGEVVVAAINHTHLVPPSDVLADVAVTVVVVVVALQCALKEIDWLGWK